MQKTSVEICKELMDNTKNKKWDYRPVSGTAGIYAIKEKNVIIYVGRSKDIRRRLKEHFRGTSQAIDKYLASRSESYKDRHITINYVADADHHCTEGSYIQCVKNAQGEWPKYNKQKGNSCQRA